mgnify:CR=1 FL=1
MGQPKVRFLVGIFLTVLISSLNPAFAEIADEYGNKEKAIEYRVKGYQAQKIGQLLEALAYYQKSVMIDPRNASVYNDIGIVYEMLGNSQEAEKSYLDALTVDSSYTDVYSNLALLYEKKGDFYKAARYWMKRAYDGKEDDLWAQKARQRLVEIGKIMPEVKQMYANKEAQVLASKVLEDKQLDTPSYDTEP